MVKRSKQILIAGLMLALFIYIGAYAYFRFTAELIHRKTWGDSLNYHSIEAVGPSGRDIFGTLMVMRVTTHTNLQDAAQFKTALIAAAKASDRRRKHLGLLFTPCRWAESACWFAIDWRRQE